MDSQDSVFISYPMNHFVRPESFFDATFDLRHSDDFVAKNTSVSDVCFS